MTTDDELMELEPVAVPPECRGKLIQQVLKGVINPADFPDVFPRRKRIIVTLPPEPPDFKEWERKHVIWEPSMSKTSENEQ